MKEELCARREREVLALAAGIAYSVTPDWYESTYRSLKMNLLFPKERAGHAPQPCLLFVCGGAYSVVNGAVWLPEMMYFARRGYTVATIEYRTSNQACFPAALVDVKAAVRFLKAHAQAFCIDPARIVIAGESAGGTLSALAGATAGQSAYEQGDYLNYDSRVAAVVDFYGPVDLENMARPAQSEDVHNWTLEAFLGAGYSPETARAASAMAQITPDAPPFLILHGTEDALVDIRTQSDAFYERLCALGVPATYYRLRGAGHGDAAFYQDEIKEKILRFMNGVFGGV